MGNVIETNGISIESLPTLNEYTLSSEENNILGNVRQHHAIESTNFATVIELGMKNWIMDAIARESALSLNLRNHIIYLPVRKHQMFHPRIILNPMALKGASTILYLHHRTYFRLFEKYRDKPSRVYITHLDNLESLTEERISALNQAQRIIFQNEMLKNFAVGLGLNEKKCIVCHGAVSESIFYPSSAPPKVSYVLVVGECKPRKNPNLIRAVIESMPNTRFVIHGKGWTEFFGAHNFANLTLINFEFSKHPKLMREASTLLTLSSNEGGPFTILESLASGTPVISTPVGVAPELVTMGNGFILSVHPTLSEIASAIQESIKLKNTIFHMNLLPNGHDWKSEARALYLS